MTWVLVIWFSMGQAGGLTSIPGYGSKTECESAAAVMRDYRYYSNTYCIPGPSTLRDGELR